MPIHSGDKKMACFALVTALCLPEDDIKLHILCFVAKLSLTQFL